MGSDNCALVRSRIARATAPRKTGTFAESFCISGGNYRVIGEDAVFAAYNCVFRDSTAGLLEAGILVTDKAHVSLTDSLITGHRSGGTSRYIKVHYITLHRTALHYITSRYITLYYITLHYTTLHYTTLHYTTLH